MQTLCRNYQQRLRILRHLRHSRIFRHLRDLRKLRKLRKLSVLSILRQIYAFMKIMESRKTFYIIGINIFKENFQTFLKFLQFWAGNPCQEQKNQWFPIQFFPFK